MECQSCGGPVIWMGPLVNLTHTECLNNQVVECEHEEDEEEDTDED